MRLIMALAAMSAAQEYPEFTTRHVQLDLERIEVGRHARDGERYAKAEMFPEAEREFWFAELKAFGLPRCRDLAAQARNARLELRDRRRRP